MIIELTQNHSRRLAALAVPGCYWDREKQWYCVDHPTARAAAAAITLFPDVLNRHPELLEIRDAAYGEARPTDYATTANLTLDPVLNGVELYDWQNLDGGYLRAVMCRDGAANVLWDRGLGKTTLSAAFIQKLGAQFTLVVCRNDAKDPVWKSQLIELLPNHNVVVLPNAKAKRERCLEMVSRYDFSKAPLVFVVHYEALALIAGEKGKGEGWSALPEIDLMVFDEGHRLATMNPNSPHKNTQIGKATMKARRRSKIAVNLTGSSIMNHAEDLFGQLHYLLPGTYKAKWRDYNDRFLDYVDDGSGAKVCIGFKPETLPQLRDELGVFSVYRKKSEVLDLPPLIKQEIKLDLLPAQRKAYEQMRDQFWAEVEDGVIGAGSVLGQLTHLRQIATWVEGLPSVKLDFALSELEEEPDEQFVAFTWYKAPGRALADLLAPGEAVVVDGDVPAAERAARLESHRLGGARVLIGSIATLGESLNLQYCHNAIRLDRHWNPGVNAQTEDRLYRHGQQNAVVLRDLIARDTVDELRVAPRLKDKESLRKAVFGV